MAEAESEKPEGAEKEKAKVPLSQSPLVKVLLGVAVVVVILGVVFLTTFYFTKYFRTAGTEVEPSIGVGPDVQVIDPPLAFDMDKFTVIVFDDAGRSYNLRVHVMLTVNPLRSEAAEVTSELLLRKVQLTDGIYEVLVAIDPKDLMGTSNQRSEGVANLKASIVRSVNARMKNKIDGCLLQEFIFQ